MFWMRNKENNFSNTHSYLEAWSKLALIFTMLDNFMYYIYNPERSGSVVEYLSRDRWDGGLSLTNVTVMCP